ALAVDPWGYLTKPASAYATVCGADNTCAAGYTVFCCTINGGANTCPPDSFIGGWWKADNSSFCGGSARYYIDCNAYRDGRYSCHCNQSTCDQRRVACNQFRYGQCNTQIPWSNTGPVLCRMISCTPPWVQFGGTCSSSSATDNNTASHSAPCLTGRPPVGVIDQVTVDRNLVRISGWAYDPDQPATSLRIVFYEDGRSLTVRTADIDRPDVNAAFHVTGRHGFSLGLTASTGVHQFKVYALSVGGGSNALIGTRSVNVNPGSAPTGHLDTATAKGNLVRLTGWAFDRDEPGAAVRIVVYQDGKALTATTTNVARPDVNAAFGISGTHGFSVPLTATNGLHNYKVYAMNLGRGTGNPLIGNRDIVVNPGAKPVGHLDSVTASGNTVRLTGWAYDPDQPFTEISVAVYEDGNSLHWHATGVARPDVNAAHHISGNHGFDISVQSGSGVHTFSVYGINVGGGTTNPLLGSKTVAVNSAAAVGNVESLTTMGTTVTITGWAYDPDRPSAPIPITVFQDGRPMSRHSSGLARPDINRAYRTSGNHGFRLSLTASPGTHTFTVYAAGTADGAPGSLIGGQTVVIESPLESRNQGASEAGMPT
ncbi:MAG: hypothetical protein QOK10_176, partial [Pseudonocardiales bacterium]|nr:hypothetical protein [Pseudonocardiales bacterium]